MLETKSFINQWKTQQKASKQTRSSRRTLGMENKIKKILYSDKNKEQNK